jgi:serine/threonine-protein kinase HipA
MNRCPITYENISEHEHYSRRGLSLLSPQLKDLNPLTLSADELRHEAIDRVGKMSIQGVQKKLSAELNIKTRSFVIVNQNGHYILKPPSEIYPELPENEALTMSLASTIGLEVPIHGLIYAKDKSLTYFIKRFDRIGRRKKLALEDFAQLSNEDRHTKYNSSMEKIVSVIEQFCTFPKIEFVKLFKLTLFNFLIGNEDMHLKNFSLITRDNKISLSPAYDLLNSSIAQKNVKEEIALPIRGRKNNLTRGDLFDYFALERLGLNQKTVAAIEQEFQQAIPKWQEMIGNSFLSPEMQKRYLLLLEMRCKRLLIIQQKSRSH